MNNYKTLVINLNPDRTDCAGNKYPVTGYVEAELYIPDKDIRHGLYGVLNGQDERWLNIEEGLSYCVIKTEENNELISLDDDHGLYKFRAGFVLFSGSLSECRSYISSKDPYVGAFGFKAAAA